MAENSKIEWTDSTFNPWWGCVEVFGDNASVSACLHCYARELSKLYGFDVWGPDKPRRFFPDKHWREPERWNQQAKAFNLAQEYLETCNPARPPRVFCASMCDIFEDYEGPTAEVLAAARAKLAEKAKTAKAFKSVILGGKEEMWHARQRLWRLIEATPNLTWQLLTKRPENMVKMTPDSWRGGWPANVIAMTTVENQKAADERIPHLLAVPAKTRGLSMEPLREAVDFDIEYDLGGGLGIAHQSYLHKGIHWVITGGESGPKAKPSHPEWFRSIRDACVASGVAYFHKQNGEWLPVKWLEDDLADIKAHPNRDGRYACMPYKTSPVFHLYNTPQQTEGAQLERVGKKAAGRLLDGQEWSQFPSL